MRAESKRTRAAVNTAVDREKPRLCMVKKVNGTSSAPNNAEAALGERAATVSVSQEQEKYPIRRIVKKKKRKMERK